MNISQKTNAQRAGGMQVPLRNGGEGYAFGYQGQIHDNEITNGQSHYAFEYRMSDSRLVRFWSVDPLRGKYPELSTYQFSSNSTIYMVEVEGLEGESYGHKQNVDSRLLASGKISTEEFIALKSSGGKVVMDILTESARGVYNWCSTLGTGVHNAVVVYIPKTFGGSGGVEWDPYVWTVDEQGNQDFKKVGWDNSEHREALKSVGNTTQMFILSGIGGEVIGIMTRVVAKTTKRATTVLGKVGEYEAYAQSQGANYFHVADDVWAKMTPDEKWAANQKFLDEAVERGDSFKLSHKVTDVKKEAGYFRKELDYLIDKKKYKLNTEGTELTK